jgi:hypothetical protein
METKVPKSYASDKHNDEVAMLLAQTGPLNGQRFALRDMFVIGRDGSCDIVVSDRQISRKHARFSISPDGVYMEDLGSKNGTHVNGNLIQRTTLLSDGDIIQVALVQKFIFLSSDATVPLELQETEIRMPAALPAGRLRLDKKSHRVWIFGDQNEQEILPPLSASQFRLLEKLYESQGQVVSRRELAIVVWGEKEAYNISEQALDALVRRLRDRITEIDPQRSYINTVRGHGLRLDNPEI